MKHADFPDNISPFPHAGDLLYCHRTALTYSNGTEFRPPLPLQKLRPIRGNRGEPVEYSECPANFHEVEFPEKAAPENLLNCQESVVALPPEIEFQPPVMLQTLPPIRTGGDPTECCDSPANVSEVELPEEEGDTGNGWSQEDTLALLKIRSEMDAEFRDTNPSGPLWEIVSRKLEGLGYHKNPKNCKEKFKNIYKSYKRSKQKQVSNQGDKMYKFVDELEALCSQNNNNPTAETLKLDDARIQTPDPVQNSHQIINVGTNSIDFWSDFSSSDEDNNDDSMSEDIIEPMNWKRKRKTRMKLEVFFENLMHKVIKKQEEMHRQLMEIIEKRERDRIIREEEWKQQEMERVKRDKEMRAQEASRSLAIISFIEKAMGQQFYIPPSPEYLYPGEEQDEKHDKTDHSFDPNNRRWPKSEVQALITLRTSMDRQFRSTGPKVPMWEEISLAMSSMGYSRSAKKCKEKWENINKYFKRSIESGKKRPENAKTCPYFHELAILYKNGFINSGNASNNAIKEDEDRSTTEEILAT
ncbi:PREDICTED: trihelix transcription factor GTL1 [Nelumbo nucifera]|uniref:Trihelix transcription factor GTL1 n=2 Tax=Nelumbo nucifera TaxID=4432 RepID=A0A1U7Z8G7_NELNU|nr:PREDICTED: trihelix transcription factor GTL1 [Nelumbo nucifera]DAD20214.1 TPA_asm: hypothetical protein HUJ06_021677 [Nelumbo nucifera]